MKKIKQPEVRTIPDPEPGEKPTNIREVDNLVLKYYRHCIWPSRIELKKEK